MERQNVDALLERFNSGQATEADRKAIEELLEAGLVSLEDIEGFSELGGQLMKMEGPSPSPGLDHRFYQMLSAERARQTGDAWYRFFSWPRFAPKMAIASLALMVGLAAGYFLRPGGSGAGDDQIDQLSQQVSELQEMMMLSLLEKGSATERLKAVNLTQEMGEASRKVTDALIQTLNQDENVNVRLAALEALKPYATDSSVREALIRSISRQESPLVQISLAELMVALQEKSAVEEFEKIVESEKTPTEVKKKIRESIKVLI